MSLDRQKQKEVHQLIEEWRRSYRQETLETITSTIYPLIRWFINERYRSAIEESRREDLVGDTMMKMVDRLHQYNPKQARVSTWVCTIARNVCVDYLRSRKPEEMPEHLDHPAPISQSILGPDEMETIRGYTAFRISDQAIQEVADVFFSHAGNPTAEAVTATVRVLDEHKVSWTRFTNPYGVTTALFALIRISKLEEDDEARLTEHLSRRSGFSGLSLFGSLAGPRALAILVLLFGGGSIEVPSASKFARARSRKKRRD